MNAKRIMTCGGALSALLLCGCESSGLSPREAAAQTYPMYLYSLYEADALQNGQRADFRAPAKLAVAQVGEVAPPDSVIGPLRESKALFSRVEGIPGTAAGPASRHHHASEAQAHQQRAADQMQTMIRYARDLGMDYLFLYGGTIDTATHNSALSVLDLTIVGAFVVPSRQVRGESKASGVLVETATGRPVLSVTADHTDSRLASAVTDEDERIRLLETLRDDVTAELAKELIDACQAQAGQAAVASGR